MLDQFSDPFQAITFAAAAALVGRESARPLQLSIDQDRVIDFFHVPQFGLPHASGPTPLTESDLTLQLRIRFAYPDHAAKRLVLASLDRDDFSRSLHATQARDPGSVLGNIVSAGYLQARLFSCPSR